ncbi:MAG: helix-turn-helix domain containing protein [Saprospiraceae bacterium]|nr:helix-turn-helix domain containing protein [Saprospiraceae bacterium]
MPRVKLFDKDEVLEKAMHLFWERGYHATSIQDLVNHLGINRASLYDTFGGKQALFDSAFKHYRMTNTKAIKKFLHAEQDVKKGMRKLFLLALEQ